MSISDRKGILRKVNERAGKLWKVLLGVVVAGSMMLNTATVNFNKVDIKQNEARAFNAGRWIARKKGLSISQTAQKLVTWVHWIAIRTDTGGTVVWDQWIKGDALGGNSHEALNQTHHFVPGYYTVKAVVYYANGGRNVCTFDIHARRYAKICNYCNTCNYCNHCNRITCYYYQDIYPICNSCNSHRCYCYGFSGQTYGCDCDCYVGHTHFGHCYSFNAGWRSGPGWNCYWQRCNWCNQRHCNYCNHCNRCNWCDHCDCDV